MQSYNDNILPIEIIGIMRSKIDCFKYFENSLPSNGLYEKNKK